MQSSPLFLQILTLSPPSPVLASLRMSVELWMSLWAGHWVVETVLISTSSTLPPMLSRPHMEDFWTSPLSMSHSMNWLVSWQGMSTTSQYMVPTVEVRRGGRVNLWQSLLKVYTTVCSEFNLWTMLTVFTAGDIIAVALSVSGHDLTTYAASVTMNHITCLGMNHIVFSHYGQYQISTSWPSGFISASFFSVIWSF